jgi:hypothetical protein
MTASEHTGAGAYALDTDDDARAAYAALGKDESTESRRHGGGLGEAKRETLVRPTPLSREQKALMLALARSMKATTLGRHTPPSKKQEALTLGRGAAASNEAKSKTLRRHTPPSKRQKALMLGLRPRGDTGSRPLASSTYGPALTFRQTIRLLLSDPRSLHKRIQDLCRCPSVILDPLNNGGIG